MAVMIRLDTPSPCLLLAAVLQPGQPVPGGEITMPRATQLAHARLH